MSNRPHSSVTMTLRAAECNNVILEGQDQQLIKAKGVEERVTIDDRAINLAAIAARRGAVLSINRSALF